MAALVRNLLSKGLRVAVPALEQAAGLSVAAPYRAVHWTGVSSLVLPKADLVSGMIASNMLRLICHRHVPSLQLNQHKSVRFYSDKEPLTKKLITERVLLVLKLYDKIDASKVGPIWRLYPIT